MRNLIKAILVVGLWTFAAPAFSGCAWNYEDNSACVGDRDPGDWCTGSGTGVGDDKWHLDCSRTEKGWLEVAAARALARNVKVCGTTGMPAVDDSTLLTSTRSACPSSESGQLFPIRRGQAADVSFEFFDLVLVGDGDYDVTPECSADDVAAGETLVCCSGPGTSSGTNQCAAGTGVPGDEHYDKWPGPLWSNKTYDFRTASPDWRGRWVAPWNTQAREALRKFYWKHMKNQAEIGKARAALQDSQPSADPE